VSQGTRRRSRSPRRRRWQHLFWIVPLGAAVAFGIRVATYSIPVHRFVASAPDRPAAPAGALHVHSDRSDGRGSVLEIAHQARAAGLRFVVLADHNLAPEAPREHHGVLVLFGTEITTRDGHLLGLAYQGESPPVGIPAHQAILALRQAGGFGIVAHGHDPKAPWQRWDLGSFTGLEVYNAATTLRHQLKFPYGAVLGAALSYPLNPPYALSLLHRRPAEDLARFDQIAARRRVVALCGLDAHGFPSYEQIFAVVRTYLDVPLSGEPGRDARIVWDALRRGRSYCSFDVFGDGSRFRFHAEGGSTRIAMGETSPWRHGLRLVVDLGLEPSGQAEILLLQDGHEVARGPGPRLEHPPAGPGAYRVEVTLPVPTLLGGTERQSWILSNAIFLRRP
jgi:hypothetical protein